MRASHILPPSPHIETATNINEGTMQTVLKHNLETSMKQETGYITDLAKESFKKIAPFWPLKNLIGVNPLQGLEDLPIEDALATGAAYFEQQSLRQEMELVNRETIKWLQAFFDEGQATIPMPLRAQGLYAAWRKLAIYDKKLHRNDAQKQEWLMALPQAAEQAIAECLLRLSIPKEERKEFLTLQLTTLPGWAAYLKYRTEWAYVDGSHPHPVTQADYLAMRLIITSLLWPEAKTLLACHAQALQQAKTGTNTLAKMKIAEKNFRLHLLKQLAAQQLKKPHVPKAQLVFCIDVRSEPFRKALESTGDYQTLGFAGFFGLPVQITDTVTGESHASCPVLLSPKHEVKESPCSHQGCEQDRKSYGRLIAFKRLYQSMKYTFSIPFALVEALGMISGVWMGLRTLSPRLASMLKTCTTKILRTPLAVEPSLENITLAEQCAYAEGALKMMGLTHHFAPLIVFCGHGSTTQNNAYATALDCGACGGRHGASNAGILAAILNRTDVKNHLHKNGINIPEATHFLAAEHDTTTDEVVFYKSLELKNNLSCIFLQLKDNIEKAREKNSASRLQKLHVMHGTRHHAWLRSQDWAEVRPEWGLARNAALIVAPREITASLDLEGRCFLHSYDYTQDAEGSSLSVILTAPMVVAQWINMQYLFSTLNNVAYGGGSKITKNITGKIGIMQGNASDLMTGLPLQSVYASDKEAYHEPQRLMCVVYAPRPMLDRIIKAQPLLQKLFGNGWVQLACIEPDNSKTYFLDRALTWQIQF
jgi:uncharacterized protein YbcC (UPF0753/DUF2309 family)